MRDKTQNFGAPNLGGSTSKARDGVEVASPVDLSVGVAPSLQAGLEAEVGSAMFHRQGKYPQMLTPVKETMSLGVMTPEDCSRSPPPCLITLSLAVLEVA